MVTPTVPRGRNAASTVTRIGGGVLLLVGLIALLADLLAPGDPFSAGAAALQPPSWSHPFGSDDLGRDLLRAVVHGTRAALLISAGTLLTASIVGVAVGATAGYRGGLIDDLLMRLTELFQVMPRFFVVLAAVAVLGSSLPLLVLILGLTGWPATARLVRGQVMSVRESDHVVAARAAGATDGRLLARHVLPIAAPPVIAHASFVASGAILVEAGVSFLGLGDPTVMTWGLLLHEAHHFLRDAWWMSVFPGVAVTTTVLSLHLVGDAWGERLS